MSVWLMAWLVGSQNLRYFLLSTTSDFHLLTQRHSHIPIYGLIDTLKQRNSHFISNININVFLFCNKAEVGGENALL